MTITEEERKFYHNIYKGIYGTDKKKALIKIVANKIEELSDPKVFIYIMDYVDSLSDVEEKVKVEAKVEAEETEDCETDTEEVMRADIMDGSMYPQDDVLVEETKLQELERKLAEAQHAFAVNNMPSTKKAVIAAKIKVTKEKKRLEKEMKDEY